MNNKIFYRTVLVILIIALGALAYIYFYIIPKNGNGGGIVFSSSNNVGKIQSLFAIYGPGKGKYPRLEKPMAVATDKKSNIYVTDSAHNRVVVFNSKGDFMFEFGKSGAAFPDPGQKANWQPGTFNYPYGIDIDQDTGHIFVADMLNKRIQIFDSRGDFLDWFPKKPFGGMADEIFPTDIAVKNGKVYVCNPYQVVVFDTNGKFIRDFGMPGSGDGQFDRPNGIDVGKDGTIYVADSNNLRLQAFTPEGKFKWTFGKKVGMNNNDGREFGLPRNISVGPDGNIYIADAFHFNIKVITPEGKKIAEMGKRGVDNGTFNFPNGIEVTNDKTIYIAEKENNRVQALRLNGFVIEESES